MNKVAWLLIVLIVIIGVAGYWFVIQKDRNISTYDQCMKAGNKAQETYPRSCVTKDGHSFTEPISPDDRLVPPSAEMTPGKTKQTDD